VRVRPWLAGGAALLLALLVTCSRGGDKQERGAGQAAAGATSPPVAQSAVPVPPKAAQATMPSGAAQAQGGESCLANLKSYRYTGNVSIKLPATAGMGRGGDITLSGAAVAPDRFQSKVEAGGQPFEIISIGNDVWVRQRNGPWEKNPSSVDTPGFKPEDFCQATPAQLERAGVRGTRERVGGVDAVRYRLSANDLDKLGAGLQGPSAALTALFDRVEMNIWFTEKERWPLRITLSAEQNGNDAVSFRAEFNLSDFNAGNITIEPPR